MNWLDSLLATGVALATLSAAPAEEKRWFPPTPRSGLVDEAGIFTPEEAAQLRGMLHEAIERDEVRLVVVILKETPPVPPGEVVKAMLARQSRAWLRGLIYLSADSAAPPVVGWDGPGLAELPAGRLDQALATVSNNASHETTTGAQMLRYTADLLDELHRLRAAQPQAPTTWAGAAMAWARQHPMLAGTLFAGLVSLVLIGVRARRRAPCGLEFPVMPMPPRLGGPYAGGSRVSATFDAATIARSREHARR